ncbi:hypothetical protein AA313_de0200980 [Arthrobotrys entomopaga]|nr:hypothetical protein AA313_de0200980 [Arthrobotrys entomopaga]
MSRVKFDAKTEYHFLQNFKILQSMLLYCQYDNGDSFKEHKIDRPVPVQSLVKCKMQDNLEFLQWMKRFWDQHFPGGEYDAVGRRQGQTMGHSGPPIATRPAAAASKTRGTTPQVAGPRTRTPLGGASTTALQNEIATLKESVLGLERERDFYFSKLRDIELLLQDAVENTEETKDEIIKKVQSILYSTEVKF